MIQPNKITNARYDFSPLQKNIVYMILEQLQKHMTKDQALSQDLFNNFVVSVPVAVLAGAKNHSKVIAAAKGLIRQPMTYSYKQGKKSYDVVTTLVHTAKHEHGTDTVELYVPFEALTLLLHIGKGFTLYQMPIAMGLRSKHSKRMYELCCRWKDKGGFSIELLELRQMLRLENKYKHVNLFRERVLDVAKNELKQSADVWFDYDMQKVKSRSFNYVYFTINHNDLKAKNADKGVYPNVYNFLAIVYPPIIDDKAMRITDKLAEMQQLAAAWKKFRPVLDRFKEGDMNAKHLVNLTKKMLTEDFSVKTN